MCKVCINVVYLYNKRGFTQLLKLKTMTKQQLIAIATKKNFKIEFSQDRFDREFIGINKNNYCYHWFQIIGDYLHFNHTYSTNTGKSNKGIMHGFRIINSLNN